MPFLFLLILFATMNSCAPTPVWTADQKSEYNSMMRKASRALSLKESGRVQRTKWGNTKDEQCMEAIYNSLRFEAAMRKATNGNKKLIYAWRQCGNR